MQGDLTTGAGLDRALAGMEAIVHSATSACESLNGRSDIKAARRPFETARNKGITHFVYVSIWSIVRANQFHELMETLLQIFSRVAGTTMIPFHWRFQPVDSLEVAQRLVDVTVRGPQGMLQDFDGPEVRDFKGIAESWLMATGGKRRLINLPLPMRFSRDFASGKLLTPERKDGKVTFEQYIAEKYPVPQ